MSHDSCHRAPHELPAHQPMSTQTTFASAPPPSSPATTQRVTSGSRAAGQPPWLTPPTEWTSGDGLLDRNQLYSFTLPVSVANAPHTRERGMAELDIRDVRLVQAIHGGLSNWLLRPFAHGRFVTWEGFRTRTEALLWSTCSKILRRSQQLNLLTLEKDTASLLGLNLEDFTQRIKIHERLANNIPEHLAQQHQAISSRLPIADAVANCQSLQRQNELLKAELAAPRKAHDASATTTPPAVSAVNTPSPSRPSESGAWPVLLPLMGSLWTRTS